MAFRVPVDGQEDITDLRLLDYLLQHNDVELLCTAEDKRKNSAERARSLNAADVVFLYLPDVTSCEAVSLVSNPNTCIIGASTAFHTSDDWVYGPPELAQGQRECLRNTKYIAVPGCRAGTFVLLMRPLVDASVIPVDYPVTAFSLVGYNGGDRRIIADYLTANNPKLDSPRLYALASTYKRLPEMYVQSKLSLASVFTPVIDNFLEGLAVAIGLHPQHLARKTSPMDIAYVLVSYYQGEQFIRVASADNVTALNSDFFDIQGTSDTNHTDLFVFGSNERMVITVCLDNLGKDAAGATV